MTTLFPAEFFEANKGTAYQKALTHFLVLNYIKGKNLLENLKNMNLIIMKVMQNFIKTKLFHYIKMKKMKLFYILSIKKL